MSQIKIASGDFKYGLYWNAGVVSSFYEKKLNPFLKLSGISVLMPFFISKYKRNFFGKMIEFIENTKILNKFVFKDRIYENLYNQATALLKLNKKKQFEFESHTELTKELKAYFGNTKLSDLGDFFLIEAYDIKDNTIYYFQREELFVDALVASLSSPPYFKYYEYNDKFLIPSAEISLSPLNIENYDIITSYECSIKLPKPRNGAEILLYSFFLRKKELFGIITKDKDVICPQKVEFSALNAKTYMYAKRLADKWISDKLEGNK
ncbi:hypothetical protein XO10_00910 [Marinitoga sp. 1135]|uniref:Uncharacterized protein n=1 Tax=Marinitoga piezophila (strain DSM 14283 / JCM 11233 / KA3) TaxID=443254 RepID=H2J362_MARPK|nr:MULTISPECIES: patatin-like phospholipase family protein [Marinitoga]AEX84580.1 hypothetical protein Marpi_0123 [Marinitoga piezophila KA3]APT75100.1 hypothetical protein LN42_00850 [Marinitoga sp. 1137]NUU94873.1 hypothetical protein [Marinitoga sp. 1135]NUU96811.1 hypothetical protein [Marinitoga sp. 1138]